MVRLAFRGAVGLLAAALATACLGGQTGQPTSLNCGSKLAPGADWGGTTVRAAGEAFEGAYDATLLWREEPRSAMTHTSVELEDSASLTIVYEDAQGRTDCSEQLTIPVTVTLTTTASGLAEVGAGTLTIQRTSTALFGNLQFESARVRLYAALDETAVGSSPRGGLDALDAELPGASAEFVEAP